MNLSLTDAARLLGKTPRQVRYLIQKGRLKATKDGGQWIIRRQDLPLSATDVARGIEEQSRLKEVIETTLGTAWRQGPDKRRYSVTDLRAFQVGKTILAQLRASEGDDSAATRRLTEALGLISCGCHSFHRRDKVGYLGRAREQLCFSLSTLLLCGNTAAEEIALAMEAELLPALGGMLRAAEKRR